MKKPPNTFLVILVVLIAMFWFIRQMLSSAEKSLDAVEKIRAEQGGKNLYEKQLNELMKYQQ